MFGEECLKDFFTLISHVSCCPSVKSSTKEKNILFDQAHQILCWYITTLSVSLNRNLLKVYHKNLSSTFFIDLRMIIFKQTKDFVFQSLDAFLYSFLATARR